MPIRTDLDQHTPEQLQRLCAHLRSEIAVVLDEAACGEDRPDLTWRLQELKEVEAAVADLRLFGLRT